MFKQSFYFSFYTPASESIKAFKEKFDNVLILLNDDLKNNTEISLEKICEYLKIETNFKFDISKKYNIGRYSNDINYSIKQELYAVFKKDIEDTEKLINRDLSAWKIK